MTSPANQQGPRPAFTSNAAGRVWRVITQKGSWNPRRKGGRRFGSTGSMKSGVRRTNGSRGRELPRLRRFRDVVNEAKIGRRAIAQLEQQREARIELRDGLARGDRHDRLRSAPSTAKERVLTTATLSLSKGATAHLQKDREKALSGLKCAIYGGKSPRRVPAGQSDRVPYH